MAQRRRPGGRSESPGSKSSGSARTDAREAEQRRGPSDVDAMGQDKRRRVVGNTYGPTRRSQIMFFVAVAAVVVVIVGGWLTLVSIFDKPPIHFKDTAPWSTTATSAQLAAQQNTPPVAPSSPCGEPGNEYPVPPESPCAPPSKANANQGASSGNPSNVAGVSDGQ